ncbi:hypothetical protein INT47_009544 [Mucor saturninus]|uniref:Uncharacterized protein n=1 Tax=Mucor saturninus TaxID=64648 RepID=A0A8H7R6F7_9FUNG|nr:hypothetical protein INT47_009544 [Mucor saturninus]
MRLDPATDPLHLLMTHCPGVEEFCFQRTNFIFATEWIYLHMVLEQRPQGWALRNLAECFDKDDYDSYYACAWIMRNSLRHFYLKRKVSDYKHHFKDFQNLAHLYISRHVIQDIVESDPIVNALPNLISLDVDFHVPKPQQSAARKNKQLADQSNDNSYARLKKLKLKNMPVTRDLDFSFIIDKFTGLEILDIKVLKSKPWPISKMSFDGIQLFFSYVCKISSYSVYFRDIDIVTMMNIYYSRIDDKKQAFDLTFTNILDEGENAVSLEVTNDDGRQEKLQLVYNLNGKTVRQRMDKAQKTLAGISQHIDEMNVSLMGKHSVAKRIDDFIPVVLGSCKELKKVTFHGGELHHKLYKKLIQVDGMRHLGFRKSCLDTHAITFLSNSFPYIECFEMDNCTFVNNQCLDNTVIIDLNMIHTVFGCIKISLKEIGMPRVTRPADKHEFCAQAVEIVKSYLFIIINFFGQEQTTKYYGGDILKGDLVTVDRDAYYRYLDECSQTQHYQLNVYCLNVKSIERLYFTTPKRHFVLKMD